MTGLDDVSADAATRKAWRETAGDAPPASLDAAIVAQARDAVAAPARRRRGWPAIVATAAVVVLGLQILFRLPSTPGPDAVLPMAPARPAPAGSGPPVEAVSPAAGAIEHAPLGTPDERAWLAPRMPPSPAPGVAASAPAASLEQAPAPPRVPAPAAAAALAAPFPASAPPAKVPEVPPVLFEQAAAKASRIAPPENEYALRLDAVRAALDRGDEDDARTLLERLREVYPERAVPDDIARRLPPR